MSTGVINSKNTFSGVIKDKQTLEGSLNLNATPPSAFKDADDLVTKSTISFKNNRVNHIANNVFSYNHNLVSVDAPNVEVIKSQAFKGCDVLTDVNIPKCDAILDEGFKDATALTRLELPADNTKVGNSCFEGCTSLQEVIAPNMTSVGQNAFKGCSSLKSVNYPNAKVGSRAFQNCNLDTVVVSSPFGGVDSLTTGTGGDTDLGNGVFYNSTVKHLKLNGYDIYLNIDSFEGFNASELIDFNTYNVKILNGTNVREFIGNTISDSSLTAKAPKLQEVNLSELYDSNITGGRCFKDYKNLKKVNLGDCRLSYESFQGCSSLEVVETRANKIPSSCFYNNTNLRRVNSAKDGTFSFIDNTGGYHEFIIEGSAFCYCYGMKVIILNRYLTSIGENAFLGCDNLELVLFDGSSYEWNNISIASGNECLLNARIVHDVTFEQYLYYINGLGKPI